MGMSVGSSGTSPSCEEQAEHRSALMSCNLTEWGPMLQGRETSAHKTLELFPFRSETGSACELLCDASREVRRRISAGNLGHSRFCTAHAVPAKGARKMIRSTCVLLLLLAAACGSNGSSSGPCASATPDPICNQSCDPAPGQPATCPEGFHCSPDAKCYAQCTAGGDECGDGYTCTYDGHCAPGDPDPGQGSGSGSDCPRVAFTAKAVTPSIQLVIDKSGSMINNNLAPNLTRWAAIRNALVDTTTGIVTQLESKAYFGATIYDTRGACPNLVTRPRALNNATSIREALMDLPSGNSNTPTAKSIRAATATFAASPPPPGSPPIMVVATDGEPTRCGDEDDFTAQEYVLQAATAAYASGIRVVPLSVASGATTEAHLQQVANIGAGIQAGQPNAPLYKGNNPAELKAAFDAIIGGAVTCDLTVNAKVTQEQAAAAVVRLNGRDLVFNTDWILVGDNIIRIQGQACTDLKSAAMPNVEGTFPCGVVLE